MKKLFYYAAVAALLPLAACGGSSKQEANADTDTLAAAPDSIAAAAPAIDTPAADTLKVAEVEQENAFAEQEKVVRAFYKKAVFNGPASASTIKKYCTKKFASKLKAANEYDDGGYAVWVLRTGAQDGDGASKVTSVTADGENTVKVSYLDMGNKGTTRIILVKDGDTWKIDGATRANGKKIL